MGSLDYPVYSNALFAEILFNELSTEINSDFIFILFFFNFESAFL